MPFCCGVVPRSDNPAEKIARIHRGCSDNGLRFTVDAEPIIAPGPGPEDRDGCEDPTVVVTGGETFVYYSGWNEAEKRGELSAGDRPRQPGLDKARREAAAEGRVRQSQRSVRCSLPRRKLAIVF